MVNLQKPHQLTLYKTVLMLASLLTIVIADHFTEYRLVPTLRPMTSSAEKPSTNLEGHPFHNQRALIKTRYSMIPPLKKLTLYFVDSSKIAEEKPDSTKKNAKRSLLPERVSHSTDEETYYTVKPLNTEYNQKGLNDDYNKKRSLLPERAFHSTDEETYYTVKPLNTEYNQKGRNDDYTDSTVSQSDEYEYEDVNLKRRVFAFQYIPILINRIITLLTGTSYHPNDPTWKTGILYPLSVAITSKNKKPYEGGTIHHFCKELPCYYTNSTTGQKIPFKCKKRHCFAHYLIQ